MGQSVLVDKVSSRKAFLRFAGITLNNLLSYRRRAKCNNLSKLGISVKAFWNSWLWQN